MHICIYEKYKTGTLDINRANREITAKNFLRNKQSLTYLLIINAFLDQANGEEYKLATRGILDKVKNKVNQVEKTAEEYKNKAKGTTTT